MDFRCFPSLDLEVPAEGAILIGDNAQGKTSMLEAICVLVRLHSPRTHRMTTLGRIGSKGFGIAGDPWGSERQVRHSREGLGPESRTTNHAPARPRYLEDGGLVVWMGNEDLELVRGPGEGRRRYLDFLGAQIDPALPPLLVALPPRAAGEKPAAQGRPPARCGNPFLRGNPGRTRHRPDGNPRPPRRGTRPARRRGPAGGQRQGRTAHPELPARQRPGSARIACSRPANAKPACARPSSARTATNSTCASTACPPRTSPARASNARSPSPSSSPRATCSNAAAAKLPIYLMDDIFGELDPGRRNALMNHLPPLAQKWITTTHLDWLKETSAVRRHRTVPCQRREGESQKGSQDFSPFIQHQTFTAFSAMNIGNSSAAACSALLNGPFACERRWL